MKNYMTFTSLVASYILYISIRNLAYFIDEKNVPTEHIRYRSFHKPSRGILPTDSQQLKCVSLETSVEQSKIPLF